MVDTVRTEAALLALLDQANTNTNLGKSTIDRQVLRDLTVSISSIAGGIGNVVDDTSPELGGNLGLNGSNVVASNAAGPEILDVASSGNLATVRPNKATNTGLGGSGGSLDLIANGQSRLRVGTGPGQENVVYQPLGTSGLLLGSVSGSFGLHNVASSDTVASLLPNFLSESAGIGGILNAVAMIGGNLSRVTVDGTGLSFFGGATVAKPTVSGSRAGNAALASLLTALDNLGLITDSSIA